MSTWAQLGLQDAITPVIEEFTFFHDFTLIILAQIIGFVGSIMILIAKRKVMNKGFLEGQIVECVWTLVPASVLIQVAFPSLVLLYTLEESLCCNLGLKTVGHQWYWSYEYRDFVKPSGEGLEFDSYIAPLGGDLGIFQLLDVDNRLVVPLQGHIRAYISSADVLHSWSIPVLGVKVDARPGRLNQASFIRQRVGLYYGQCSEICGANHSFIPISLEVVGVQDFIKWISLNLS